MIYIFFLEKHQFRFRWIQMKKELLLALLAQTVIWQLWGSKDYYCEYMFYIELLHPYWKTQKFVWKRWKFYHNQNENGLPFNNTSLKPSAAYLINPSFQKFKVVSMSTLYPKLTLKLFNVSFKSWEFFIKIGSIISFHGEKLFIWRCCKNKKKFGTKVDLLIMTLSVICLCKKFWWRQFTNLREMSSRKRLLS